MRSQNYILNEQRVNVKYLSQAVSHRPLSVEDRIHPQSRSYEICGSQSGTETGTSAFRYQYHSIGVPCSFVDKLRNWQRRKHTTHTSYSPDTITAKLKGNKTFT